jgi:hypothetical protein
MVGCKYIGVDVNKLNPDFNFGKFTDNMQLYGQCDVADPLKKHIFSEFPAPTVITCFEVLEHVEPEHSVRILETIRDAIADNGIAFISTPCYDKHTGAAGNHVNEITYEALGTLIQDLGFGIEGVYGTFASQKDIEPDLAIKYPGSLLSAYCELKKYYDSNVISTFLAPLFPEASRNALWVLTPDPKEEQALAVFPKWEELETPWTSSDQWKELKP